MARRHRSKAKKPRTPDPDDVLRGRVENRPEELFDLIHTVNPTGRELPKAEEARRYAQKTQLQSLLVRRFGDEHLIVEPTPDDGVVSLVHRSGAKDACHAVLAELDPEARSWVQRQLDLAAAPRERGGRPAGPRPGAAPPPAPAADDASPAGVDELLRRGREAMSEFDYEAAEEHLGRAFDRSHGALDAALPLLDLWVGVLGMDAQALELEPRLAAAAAADPGIRTLLALAAARGGDSECALRLVKGTHLTRSAEVYAALAAQAIRTGDEEEASRYLGQVSAHDPTHPEIASLTHDLAELRAADRGPAEEALDRRRREEGCRAVEDEARALAARWPESEVARRILREIAAARREETIATALAAGEEALAAEDFGAAARHFQAALEAGSDRPDLPDLIARSQARERQQEEAAQVAAAVGRFGGGEPKEALLAYLALPETLRGRVHQEVDEPALTWLDELGAPRSGSKAQAAVAAVLALKAARERLRGGEPQAAVDELTPHLASLRPVEEARRCLGEARSQAAAGRRERAREALAAAREALDGGELERAGALLAEVDAGDLRPRDGERAARLADRLRAAETVRQHEREYQRQVAAGDYLAALDLARQQAAAASRDGSERETWQARCDELRQRLRVAWRVEEVRDPQPLAEIDDCQWGLFDTPQVWVDPDCRELVLANAWDRWLFVRILDLEQAAVVARVSLRTPEPLAQPEVCWDPDQLRIVDGNGHLIELARSRWEILRCRSLRELLPANAVIEDTVPLPATPYLWLEFRRLPDNVHESYVVDLRTWRSGRRFQGSCPMPILGPGEPRVMSLDLDEGARLYSARGAPEQELGLPPGIRFLSAALSPDGSALWAVVERLDAADEDEEVELLALEPTPRGPLRARTLMAIPEASPDAAHPMATDREQAICFILVGTGYACDLLAVAGEPSGVRQLYRAPVPARTVLAQDHQARRAFALAMAPSSLRVVPLGPEPPPARALGEPSRPRSEDHVPSWSPLLFCGGPFPETARMVLLVAEELSCSEPNAFIREFESQVLHDPDRLVILCYALRQLPRPEVDWRSLARRYGDRFPDHPETALTAAEVALEEERWEEVHDRLAAVGSVARENRCARHFHHLLGLAHLHLGRPAKARAAFRKGMKSKGEGLCLLESLIDLVRPFSDPPTRGEWSPDQPLVRQLVGAMRVADRALEAGDVEAARKALDRSAVWQACELFSAARLADVYLRTSVPAAGRFRKRQALAFFCHVYAGEELTPKKLDVLGLSWDESRLEELERRASAWLDGE